MPGCQCKICIKSCPAHAVFIEDNLIHIDHHICMHASCQMECVAKCPRHIFRPIPPPATVDIFANLRKQNATSSNLTAS